MAIDGHSSSAQSIVVDNVYRLTLPLIYCHAYMWLVIAVVVVMAVANIQPIL